MTDATAIGLLINADATPSVEPAQQRDPGRHHACTVAAATASVAAVLLHGSCREAEQED